MVILKINKISSSPDNSIYVEETTMEILDNDILHTCIEPRWNGSKLCGHDLIFKLQRGSNFTIIAIVFLNADKFDRNDVLKAYKTMNQIKTQIFDHIRNSKSIYYVNVNDDKNKKVTIDLVDSSSIGCSSSYQFDAEEKEY